MSKFDVAREELGKIARGFGYEDCVYEFDNPGRPGPWSKTRGGVPFETLCSGGVKPEGAALPVLSETPDAALTHYALSLKAYLARHVTSGRRVYWRELPRLQEITEDDMMRPLKRPLYAVYSRLAVADA